MKRAWILAVALTPQVLQVRAELADIRARINELGRQAMATPQRKDKARLSHEAAELKPLERRLQKRLAALVKKSGPRA